ncbi:hypothetical protein Pmar_PMAR020035 [Perkinsus marinus ATCC 50983]|uniref:Uncharacterized protein n=1 Tax=Perkinsus marinus (strain ATCC 50983 / TXsc) TaxID=423536 RepID=C5L0J3_PERM5|nr:hypothetical protein Pmar_PMAR020035 [Perkinsus marinus ATCC 50983]EER09741.1 hypothetical protein Pmar_PMAR020035 [Perkinsus marinus ATCC 50983]|eukprot:XP_002777946.1 hypothetical protein Pmar_PMAR020035 [Perkinsus marinus ATCC 50983]
MAICGSLPPANITIRDSQAESCGPPVIICDWDDTILPSTFLAEGNLDSTGSEESLGQLQDIVIEVLSRAIVLASPYVFILTSSSPGWVHESCQLYMPKVVPLLAKVTILHSKEYCRELSVISRKFRRLYFSEDKGLKSTKLATVLSIVPTLKPVPRRVVLIGDRYEDVAVAQALRRGGVEARTCLFASAPTPTELRRELEWLLKGDTLDRLLVDDTLPQSDFTLRRNRQQQQQQQPAAKEAPRRNSVNSFPSSTPSCAAAAASSSSKCSSLVDIIGVDPKIGPMVLGLSAYFVPAGSLRQCGRCRTPVVVKAKVGLSLLLLKRKKDRELPTLSLNATCVVPALTPEEEAAVQEAVTEQLMSYGEGMASKEHRATLAEYAACVLQTQATVSEMVAEMEQFLQENAESFVEWLIEYCEEHGVAHPVKRSKKAAPPRGGGLFSKALRAATGQAPASSSCPEVTTNGTKRGVEEDEHACSSDGPSKIARREMRGIAQQADAVNAKRVCTPVRTQDENRNPIRLVGREELNQRAVATEKRSLGEASLNGRLSPGQSAAEGTLGPLIRSPTPALYRPPLLRAPQPGGLPPVEQQLGGGYVAQARNGSSMVANRQPPPPPLPPPTQPQSRRNSFNVPPVTTPQRNEDGYKWRSIRGDALVRATCEPDSAPVASITNGEIVEQCGQRIVLQSGIIRIQIRHPSHPSFPAPLGWVTLTAEPAGGVRYFEKGPEKVTYEFRSEEIKHKLPH